MPQGIGVLSSIHFSGTPLEDAFQRGLARAVYMNVQDDKGHDVLSLDNALQALNGDGNVHLIVTAGGLVAAAEAAKVPGGATKPFISLVGGMAGLLPNPGSGSFRGGVSLESFAQNPDRVAYLTAKGIPPDKICLLSNPNSFMVAAETGAWTTPPPKRGPVISAPIRDRGDANNGAMYAQAFGQIAVEKMTAVVVSADPLFKDTMDELIAAANSWTSAGNDRRVCYPLHDYANVSGTNEPRSGCILHGTRLKDAYEALGRMAANVLDGHAVGVQKFGLSAPIEL